MSQDDRRLTWAERSLTRLSKLVTEMSDAKIALELIVESGKEPGHRLKVFMNDLDHTGYEQKEEKEEEAKIETSTSADSSESASQD